MAAIQLPPEEKFALAELEALLQVPGALKIVLAWCACGSKAPHHSGNHDDCKACKDLPPPQDPKHFVWHDIVRIEGPDERGRYTCFTENYTAPDGRKTFDAAGPARPTALMRTLRKWRSS